MIGHVLYIHDKILRLAQILLHSQYFHNPPKNYIVFLNYFLRMQRKSKNLRGIINMYIN